MTPRYRSFIVAAVAATSFASVAVAVRPPTDEERTALVKLVSDDVASPAFGKLHFDDSCWDARVSTVDPAYAAVTLGSQCKPPTPGNSFADVAWILTGGGSVWKTDFLRSPQCHRLETKAARAAIDLDLFGEAPCLKLLEPRGEVTFAVPPTFVRQYKETSALVVVRCWLACRVRLDGAVRVNGRLVGALPLRRFVLCSGKELCGSRMAVTAPSASPAAIGAIDQALTKRRAIVMRVTVTVTNIASKRSASYVASARVKRGRPAPG